MTNRTFLTLRNCFLAISVLGVLFASGIFLSDTLSESSFRRDVRNTIASFGDGNQPNAVDDLRVKNMIAALKDMEPDEASLPRLINARLVSESDNSSLLVADWICNNQYADSLRLVFTDGSFRSIEFSDDGAAVHPQGELCFTLLFVVEDKVILSRVGGSSFADSSVKALLTRNNEPCSDAIVLHDDRQKKTEERERSSSNDD